MRAALLLCLALLCGGAWADSPLIRAADYLTPAQERRVPNAKRLADVRAMPQVISARVAPWVPAALNSTVITINVGDEDLHFTGTRKLPINGVEIWSGRNASIAFNAEAVDGRISHRGRVWWISTLTPKLVIVAEVRRMGGKVDEEPRREPSISPRGKVTPFGAGSTTINILTVYTPGAEAAVVSSTVSASLQIADLNAAFAASGVNITAVGVGTAVIPLDLPPGADVYAVFTAAMADGRVFSLRDTLDADIVMIVADVTAGSAAGAVAQIFGGPYTAFAAVKVTALDDHVYQHEVGHVLGATHAKSFSINDSTACIKSLVSNDLPTCVNGDAYIDVALQFSNPSTTLQYESAGYVVTGFASGFARAGTGAKPSSCAAVMAAGSFAAPYTGKRYYDATSPYNFSEANPSCMVQKCVDPTTGTGCAFIAYTGVDGVWPKGFTAATATTPYTFGTTAQNNAQVMNDNAAAVAEYRKTKFTAPMVGAAREADQTAD